MSALVPVLVMTLAGTEGGAHPRVIGGSRARIEDFPWQVSVLVWGEHHCGGSIISKSCVLTAAHCIQMSFKYQVRAGSTYLSGGTVYDVYDKKAHEDFNKPPYSNDIGVLKVRPEFRLGKKMQIVPLATSRPPPGTSAMVSGWGTTSEEGDLAHELRYCTVQVMTRSQCREYYLDKQVTESMLCAGQPWGGVDACKGDSGGPLVHRGRQVGVVSFGKGCGRPMQPGVYADVATLRAWITKHAGMR